MDTKAAILALMGAWGVSALGSLPAAAEETTGANPLLNKVWVRTDADPALPGPMQIFLEDGTLVSDSCWETYRLSKWEQTSDTSISWDEDGMTIAADIASLTDEELVLHLQLTDGMQEQRFAVATAPYVCPDMVK